MLLSLVATAVVAAFVLSVAAALLISTRRAASLDDGSMVDVVLDRRRQPRVGGGRPM
ncbi:MULTISPECIES: hypothetical protein [Aeromicrobium]|uniref:hypothetical protein n=1 Tax=Aeromicrobium TaxID=2040 RepID=UPI000AE46C75|nr:MULTISPECIES: hypothetical protein [Aeromicrobium]MBD8607599.1 hypothetical protein [Aeromicrobium sp. CFBP 8757]MCL8252414.1 hypothetical protein [Aeromicrobium fastidiosum]